jgi:PKD repeat protein
MMAPSRRPRLPILFVFLWLIATSLPTLAFPPAQTAAGDMLPAATLPAQPDPIADTPADSPTSPRRTIMETFPLAFEPNVGQHADAAVQFQVRGMGGTIGFTPADVILALPVPQDEPIKHRPDGTPDMTDPDTRAALDPFDPAFLARQHARAQQAPPPTLVRMRLRDANPQPTITGVAPQPGTVNYIVGTNPDSWHTDIPTYAGIVYTVVYPGIDLRYDGTNGQLKSTYQVAPGADPTRIRWAYTGIDDIRVDPSTGDLVITLPDAPTAHRSPARRELLEQAPIAWQEVAGQRMPVTVQYDLAADGSVGFALGAYDPAYPLIIDPTIVYNTYLGEGGTDRARGIAVDTTGRAYITGSLYESEAFVTRLNPAGTDVEYTTIIGGSSTDIAYGIAVDSAGNASIAGVTYSPDFPTQNAFDATCGTNGTCNATHDAFVAHLDTSGVLTYATYIGGVEPDVAQSIAVDTAGKVYITGRTRSGFTDTTWNFPTRNAYQETCVRLWPNCEAAFVTRLDPAQSGDASLEYSTYLDGDNPDDGRGIAVDADANIYVTGSTGSTNLLPTTRDLTFHTDVFVARLDAGGGSIDYGFYLGGSSDDVGNGIAVDPAGNAYIVGRIGSDDTQCGQNDAFVLQADPTGTVIADVCLGGSAYDVGHAIAVEGPDTVLVTGLTTSADFPTRQPLRAFDGSSDVFVTRLDLAAPAAEMLQYSTALGGRNTDSGLAIATDSTGAAYVAGFTLSDDFLLQPSDIRDTFGGEVDAFVVKIDPREPPVTIALQDTTGADVSALALNDDGWPALNADTGAIANPITVTVTLTNSTDSTVFNSFYLSLGGQPGESDARFRVVTAVPGCQLTERIGHGSFDNENSVIFYQPLCNLEIAPGQVVQKTWGVWIQPSQVTEFVAAVELFDLDTTTLIGETEDQLTVPRATIHPVIFIAGITATTPPQYNEGTQADADEMLFWANKVAGYSQLDTALAQMGYEKGHTYFRFPYDWLTSHITSSLRLRDDLILPERDTVAAVPWTAAYGDPDAVTYDLIGHSGGTMVARAYIQGPHWQGHVRRFVSIGGLHKGLTSAYTLLESGRDRHDIILTQVTRRYALPRAVRAGYGDLNVSAENMYLYAHDPISGVTSLPELLPVYTEQPYLIWDQTPFPFGRLANPLLEEAPGAESDRLDPYRDVAPAWTNIQARHPDFTGVEYHGFNTPSAIAEMDTRLGNNLCVIFAGDTSGNPAPVDQNEKDEINDTRVQMEVRAPRDRAPYWWTGSHKSNRFAPGDTLVPGYSGNPKDILGEMYYLDAFDLDVQPDMPGPAEHLKLVSYSATHKRIAQCLIGTSPTGPISPETQETSETPEIQFAGLSTLSGITLASAPAEPETMEELFERGLLISANGPVELTLTDPQGRRTGFDPTSPDALREIPLSTYTFDADLNLTYIDLLLPALGDYTLTVTGTGAGDYWVLASYNDSSGLVGLLYTDGSATTSMRDTHTLIIPTQAIDVPQPPDVQAGPDITTEVNQPVTLSGTFTDINPGDTHTIDWAFGDGATATGTLTPTHTYTNTGVYTATLTVDDNTGFVISDTLQVQVTAPAPGNTDLALQYRVGESGGTSATNSDIKPVLNLINNGTTDIPFSELTVRYWYTIDTDQPQSYACDWAVVNCANITHQFVPLSSPRDGADHYLELGFTSSAGTLPGGGSSGDIQSRITKTDFSSYDETDDYSFDPTKTSFTDWTQVTLYRNGVLIWGTEPN